MSNRLDAEGVVDDFYFPGDNRLLPRENTISYQPAQAGLMLRDLGWLDQDGDPLTPRTAEGVEGVPDGSLLVAGQDGRILRYDPDLESIADTWDGHEDWVWDLAVDPTRPQVASASMDGTVRLWSLEDGTSRVLRRHTRIGIGSDWLLLRPRGTGHGQKRNAGSADDQHPDAPKKTPPRRMPGHGPHG